MKTKQNESYPEVRDLLEQLIKKGFVLTGFDDGDEDGILTETNNLNDIVEAVHSVDECQVELEKNGNNVNLFFFLENEQGVALNDYSCDETLMKIIDEVSSEIYDKYNV